jgi:hypothetical protein
MLRRCPHCQAVAAAAAFAVVAPSRLGWAGGLLRRRCPTYGHVGAEPRAFPVVRAAVPARFTES